MDFLKSIGIGYDIILIKLFIFMIGAFGSWAMFFYNLYREFGPTIGPKDFFKKFFFLFWLLIFGGFFAVLFVPSIIPLKMEHFLKAFSVGFGTLAIFDTIGGNLSNGMKNIAENFVEDIDKNITKQEKILESKLGSSSEKLTE